MKNLLLALIVVGSASAQAFEVECKSFTGHKATASISTVESDSDLYLLTYSIDTIGEDKVRVEFIENETVFGPDDSPYGETSFSVVSDELPSNFVVKYLLTSDGPDYLYFNDVAEVPLTALSCE